MDQRGTGTKDSRRVLSKTLCQQVSTEPRLLVLQHALHHVVLCLRHPINQAFQYRSLFPLFLFELAADQFVFLSPGHNARFLIFSYLGQSSFLLCRCSRLLCRNDSRNSDSNILSIA